MQFTRVDGSKEH